MDVVAKVRKNMDKTVKMMIRKSRELPFPEPYWLRDPIAIVTMMKQRYSPDLRGMIDVYQVGTEEVGSILCVDAQGKGELLLGRECRGKGSFVVVKDCKPFGLAVGTYHTHPGSQPCLSPGDFENGIPGTFFSCLGWKDLNRQYWLKAVALDNYYFMPYEDQIFIDQKIDDALVLEKEMQNIVKEVSYVPCQDTRALANRYIRMLVALCTSIEAKLGAYTVQL